MTELGFTTKCGLMQLGRGEIPRRFYVYAHCSEAEEPFYVGKGTGQRAWSTNRNRDEAWRRYILSRLGGRYLIARLVDDLDEGKR